MKGLEIIAPDSVAGTSRSFRFTVADNETKDGNGVSGAVRTEYYLVRVAANAPTTPTSGGGGGGGCSAFGFATLALLLLAPLSLLRRR